VTAGDARAGAGRDNRGVSDEIDTLLASLAGVRAPDGVTEFAEQFGADVSGITDAHRAALTAAVGKNAFAAVVRVYLADFLPRVRAGLEALGLPVAWSDDRRPESGVDVPGVVFDRLLPGIARLRDLDPVTTEVVRLRGARAHNCRLCKSLREGAALDAGGSESLYDDIERYEQSHLLGDSHKAALRYADALIWTPSHIEPAVAAGVLEYFGPVPARELTLDVMRNASNKIAVALKADAPRVAHGTERYLVDADGQTVFD